jgi:hypothetical protein
MKTIQINRAPVLTLWAAIVAERLGYHRDAALTFGRTVAGLNAAAKARGLGIAEPGGEPPRRKLSTRPKAGRQVEVSLLGRTFHAVETEEGLRALADGKPISAESVERYLEGKFGEDLEDARASMKELARSRPKEPLAAEAYALYEKFRPAVPRSTRGWGAKGALDLELIHSLARKK